MVEIIRHMCRRYLVETKWAMMRRVPLPCCRNEKENGEKLNARCASCAMSLWLEKKKMVK